MYSKTESKNLADGANTVSKYFSIGLRRLRTGFLVRQRPNMTVRYGLVYSPSLP